MTKRAAKPSRPRLSVPDGLVVGEKAVDPYRRSLALPKPPFPLPQIALDEQRRSMAMDDVGPGGFPFGNFLNTAFGQGSFGLFFPGYPYLAELAQRSEFRQPVETTAKEMTRKWISLKSKSKGDKADQIADLESDMEEFGLQTLFRRLTEHDGFYGMGLLFVQIKGNKDPSEPLVIDANTIPRDSLLGFTTVEPMWVSPLMWNSNDPTLPNFYKPDSWTVMGRKVDSSRLFRFVSREVPDIIKPAYNFGGISLTQLIQPYVDRWLQTVNGVNKLINNFSIVSLQTDLAEILQGGLGGAGGNDFRKRIELFIKARDNQGLFVLDKETEILEQLAVPLSGLGELQAQAQEHMAAPTHLPLVVLTGITPAGLNASSDSEIEVFHDWILSSQEQLYGDALRKIIRILQLNRTGKIDDDIVAEFVPLKQLTGEALARVKKSEGEQDVQYIDAGVVSAEEVRERLTMDPDSGYNNLSSEMPRELEQRNDIKLEAALNPHPEPDGDEGGDGDE